MKKMPKIILSILTIGLVSTNIGSTSASALYVDDYNATWYTVDELLEYKTELDQEEFDLCGYDIKCSQELFFARMEDENPKYWALEQLMEQQITVTAINPGEETVKVLFFNEEMMLHHMGIHEPLELGEFFMGWFEGDLNQNYNYSLFADELFGEVSPGAHLIYAQRDNDGDKILANQEVEISAAGSELALNTSGEITYGVRANPYFNASGRFIYTSCLGEPDYAEGVECKMMISAERGIAYFPPRETVITDDNEQTEDVLDQQNSTDQQTGSGEESNEPNAGSTLPGSNTPEVEMPETGELGTSEPEMGESEIEGLGTDKPETEESETGELGTDKPETGISEMGVSQNLTESARPVNTILTENKNKSSDSVKAPETGTLTKECDRVVEFPWWLGLLLALGNAALLWLFWPSRKKMPKKS